MCTSCQGPRRFSSPYVKPVFGIDAQSDSSASFQGGEYKPADGTPGQQVIPQFHKTDQKHRSHSNVSRSWRKELRRSGCWGHGDGTKQSKDDHPASPSIYSVHEGQDQKAGVCFSRLQSTIDPKSNRWPEGKKLALSSGCCGTSLR